MAPQWENPTSLRRAEKLEEKAWRLSDLDSWEDDVYEAMIEGVTCRRE
jgi:hypothetical protein